MSVNYTSTQEFKDNLNINNTGAKNILIGGGLFDYDAQYANNSFDQIYYYDGKYYHLFGATNTYRRGSYL
jgi:hypothetical protein